MNHASPSQFFNSLNICRARPISQPLQRRVSMTWLPTTAAHPTTARWLSTWKMVQTPPRHRSGQPWPPRRYPCGSTPGPGSYSQLPSWSSTSSTSHLSILSELGLNKTNWIWQAKSFNTFTVIIISRLRRNGTMNTYRRKCIWSFLSLIFIFLTFIKNRQSKMELGSYLLFFTNSVDLSHMVKSGTMWYHVTLCGITWYRVASCSIIWYPVASSGTMWYRVVSSGIVWYRVTSCGIMWDLVVPSGIMIVVSCSILWRMLN